MGKPRMTPPLTQPKPNLRTAMLTGTRALGKTRKKPDCMYTGFELSQKKITEQQFLVEKLIPKGAISVLVGPSDLGKSSLVRNLAVDIVLGSSTFLGRHLHLKYRQAVYISTEDSPNDWQRKIAMYKLPFPELETLRFLHIAFNPDNLASLVDWMLQNPSDLVVCDTFTDLMTGDSNQTIDIRKFFQNFQKVALAHDTAVVFVHHLSKKGEATNMPSKANILGSSAIEAKARCVIEMRPGNVDETRALHITKANHLSAEEKKHPIYLKMTGDLRFEPTSPFCTKGQDTLNGISVEMRIHELHKEKKSSRVIATMLQKEGYVICKSKVAEIIQRFKQSEESDDGLKAA